jgi:hypothetical protein
MPKFYIKWQLNPQWTPATPEERVKLWLSLLEMVKPDIKAGKAKDWGCVPGEACGYTIREDANEVELFTALLRWMPYVNFEVKPILTVEQTEESIKKAVVAAQAK